MKTLSSSVSSEHDELIDEAVGRVHFNEVGDDLSAVNPSMGVHVGRQRADGVLIVAIVER